MYSDATGAGGVDYLIGIDTGEQREVYIDGYGGNAGHSVSNPSSALGVHSIRLCGDMSDRVNTGYTKYGKTLGIPSNFALNSSENYPGTCGPWTNFTVNASCSTLPDLSAGGVLPTITSTGVTNFKAAIRNAPVGGAIVANTTINEYFQVASSTNGGGTIQTLAYFATSTGSGGMAKGSYGTSTLSYGFNTGSPAGQPYSVRLCVDLKNPSDMGNVIEVNENNNCGPWTNITVTQANLTASTQPTTVASGAVTLSGSVINNGSAATQSGVSFSNYFQVASSTSGGGTIQDINSALNTPSSLSNFAVGSQTVTVPYKFNTAGTFSYRLCADGTSSAAGGTISESNSADNCGAWTDIIVSPTWTTYCTGAQNADPANDWTYWQSDNSVPQNWRYFAPGDGSCAPPPPTNPVGSCNAAGTLATISWTAPASPPGYYTTYYTRVRPVGSSTEFGQPGTNDSYTGTSMSFPTGPGLQYDWWVHTKAGNGSKPNGMWSTIVNGTTITCPVPAVAPTVTLTPTPAIITKGQSVQLTWTSSGNITSCTASNSASDAAFVGSVAFNSATPVTVSPIVNTTYTLSCTGPGGTTNNPQLVTVNPKGDPHIFLSVPRVHLNTTAQLSWYASNVSSCSILGPKGVVLSGFPMAANGSHAIGSAGAPILTTTPSITSQTTFTLSCKDMIGGDVAPVSSTVYIIPTYQEK